MELLKEVANISGKSGLYRILKPTRTGVIVESLDGKKERSVVGANARVSVLKDISVYMSDHQDSSVPLADIFFALKEKYNEGVELNTKTASDEELYAILGEVAPDFDRERVYPSDVKKIINWFNTLLKNLPEAFEVKTETAAQ
ncbi:MULTISPECIES: DUF5606 family protein [Flectobacillus]|jgi:hypothetical protein|uniref:DUF5606 domain-containing protein n=1 Tax=Flectobacillus roseus TaxID=502259 RepID=A0ABT6YBV1_9BACT|nr:MULTISPECIES: DUF5606 domain-containing protein [Flectobacillus]MDI9861050.1 DUF5606 domain-containing protein [Flectobacillus roseus]MDI9870242.1 DUF5606 domain-containing protein [Flectobacillus roseus]NBA75847.1 hypothetical protein [Emticicia sp. ODNR4P]PAC32070.1 hypothetical protein BWI92_06860 [Flectobacillus sp. BAB-3569]